MENFDKAIEEIKARRNAETLSDEAKKRIVKALDEAAEKKFAEKKRVKFDYSFSQKVAAIFICCFILSSCAFAGDIGDFITKVFSNQDKNIEFAVENGYVQNIEMDYVESNGIGLKADYFYLDDYYMYIAFEVKADREFDEILLNEFEIKDENDNVIYSNNQTDYYIFSHFETKKLTNTNGILLIKLAKIENEFFSYNNLKIQIQKLEIKKEDKFEPIYGSWNIEVLVEDNNIKSEKEKYYLTSEQLVKKSKIELKNNNLKIELEFCEGYIKDFSITKNNVYLEDNLGNTYELSDATIHYEDKLKVLFTINKNFDIDNLKLKINNNDEILVFNLIKADS